MAAVTVPAHAAILGGVGMPAVLRFVDRDFVAMAPRVCRTMGMMAVVAVRIRVWLTRAGVGVHMEMIVVFAAAMVTHVRDGW